MKLAVLTAAVLLAVSGPAVAEGTLTVRFEGLSTPKGAILAALFDENAYDADGAPTAEVAAPVIGQTATADIAGLPPGRYGLKVFHDLNGDGKMNTNPFGMPTEPFAFSNDAPARFGPAKWVDAAFEVKDGANVHTITIR